MIHESNNFQFINQSIHDHKNPFTQNFQNEFYFNYPTYAEQYNDNKINNNSKISKLNKYYFYNNTKQRFPFQKSPKKKNKNNNLTSNNSNEILIIDNSVSPNTRKKFFSNPLNNSPKKINFNQSKSSNKIYNSNTSIYSSNQQYWEKRGIKSQNRLNNIKNEKLKKENEENQIKPKIIKKSIEIANKLLNKENENVFERLTNGNIQKVHEENVKKLSKKINPMKNPKINKSSKNIQRSIEDLYIWKNNIERKKKENIKKINQINKKNYKTFRADNISEEILLERKPDYLNKKVEDRLYEEGKKIEMKKNIEKERYLEDICRPISNYKKNAYSFIESRYMDIKKPKIENNKENKKKVKNITKTNKSSYIKNNQYNDNVDNLVQNDLVNENEDFNQNTNIENNKNDPELIDIRKHLNDFYEMKQNNPGKIFNYFSFINGNKKINLENELNKNFESNLHEYNKNLISNSNLNTYSNIQSSNNEFDNNKYDISRTSNQNDRRFLVQNKYMYEPQINKKDDNDYINKLINNHYNFDNNLINDDNYVNEMYEKQSEHLDYLDERLKNNEKNKTKLLEKL